MATRTIYVKNPALWERAKQYAKDHGMSLSEVIEKAMALEVKRRQALAKKKVRGK